MIEVKEFNTKYILRHPTINATLEFNFYKNDKEVMDAWLPYLEKFEDFLIQETIRERQKKKQ